MTGNTHSLEWTLRRATAILAGLLWALAFPRIGVAGLAWIAPGLLLATALGVSRKRTFQLGYLAGLTHHLIGLYWLLYMPVPYYPILGWVALSMFLALYPACWVWGCCRLWPTKLSALPDESALGVLKRMALSATWRQRMRWSLLCGAAWVTWEMIQSRLLSGFPWNLLGASQQPLSIVTHLADRTGVYGISFLVVWTSVCLMLALVLLFAEPGKRLRWQAHALPPFVVILALCSFGWTRLLTLAGPTGSLRVALVQPSFPQTMVWDEGQSAHRFERLLALSRKAMESKPDLLVWPEAALPYPLRYDVQASDAITNLLTGHNTWLCLASDDIVFSQDSSGASHTNIYNSAFLLNPKGQITTTYAKRRLVIFGEYVPFLDWLPFLRYFTPISGGFSPGEKRVSFEIPDRGVRFAPLICFEDVFAGAARDQAQEDVSFLLNMTNDGWFGESAQQWQHVQSASMRAIENGMPLLRCANNGVTCWVESHGQLRDVGVGSGAGTVKSLRDQIYGEGYRVIDVPLADNSSHRWTVYRRLGDVFGWTMVGILVLASAQKQLSRPREPRH